VLANEIETTRSSIAWTRSRVPRWTSCAMPSGESTAEVMVDVSTAAETSATQGWKRFPGLPSACGARQAPDGTPGDARRTRSAHCQSLADRNIPIARPLKP